MQYVNFPSILCLPRMLILEAAANDRICGIQEALIIALYVIDRIFHSALFRPRNWAER